MKPTIGSAVYLTRLAVRANGLPPDTPNHRLKVSGHVKEGISVDVDQDNSLVLPDGSYLFVIEGGAHAEG